MIVNYQLYFCGMKSGELFNERTMLWAPYKKIGIVLDVDNGISISDLKSEINKHNDICIDICEEIISLYIFYNGFFIKINKNKTLSDISYELNIDELNLCSIVVDGGASLRGDKYLYVVHPNENIHKHTPHVHVKHDDDCVRYNLETIQRFEKDKLPNYYKRDEKKIIKPFIEKNRDFFMNNWALYNDGYEYPEIDAEGRAYYEGS